MSLDFMPPQAELLTEAASIAVVKQMGCEAIESSISFTKSGRYASWSQRIAQLHLPTSVPWGEHDDMPGTADAYQFH